MPVALLYYCWALFIRYSRWWANDWRALSPLALQCVVSLFFRALSLYPPQFTIDFIDALCRQRNVGSLLLQKGDEEEQIDEYSAFTQRQIEFRRRFFSRSPARSLALSTSSSFRVYRANTKANLLCSVIDFGLFITNENFVSMALPFRTATQWHEYMRCSYNYRLLLICFSRASVCVCVCVPRVRNGNRECSGEWAS